MDIQTVIAYITSPELQEELFLVRIVFIAFAAFFFAVTVYYFFTTKWFKELITRDFLSFFFGQSFALNKVARYWNKVKKRLEADAESEWKLSVMEADDLLDDILFKMGYIGESVAEKLDKVTVTTLPSADDVRGAHQIRDNIVHDPDFPLSVDKARDVIEVYQKAFDELEAF